MKKNVFSLLFTLFNFLSFTGQAQFSQPGELDTTFNFGRPHSFFTDPANPEPGTGTGATQQVNSIIIQPDGKVLIGGSFTSFNGTTRNRIARLNADGSLDASFNPGTGASNSVQSFAFQPDGKVLIGGSFTSYNGTSRNGIARLNADGSLDASFNPGTGFEGSITSVNSIVLQPDGKVLIGGSFTSYNGTSRNGIARLNADGSLDTSFNPGTGLGGTFPAILSFVFQPDGKVLIGGRFTSYNGTSRNGIARLNADGSLDASFNPGIGAINNDWSLALQPDGKVLIGGRLTSFNGTDRDRIARLNADGSLDASFNPGNGANGALNSLVLQPDGKVLIGGNFTSYNGQARNSIARLNSDGSLDASFNPGTGVNNAVWSLALQPDGKVLIGGSFTIYNGISCKGLGRLNSDGRLDPSFNLGTGIGGHLASILTLALQPDGKVLIGGAFTSYNGTSCNRIVRLNADGSLDTTFNPGTGANDIVETMALQPDGKMLIGGRFTSYNGTPSNRIARLNADGSLDASFNPGIGANDNVLSLALQPDGKVLIGGAFTSYNDTTRNYIARLNSDGSLDASFDPGLGPQPGPVVSLALQPVGKVLISGNFTNYNGTSRNIIARLNADGSLDATFDPGTGVSSYIFSFAPQSDGKVLIGGNFGIYNGTSRNRIARLNADGSLDATFNPGTGVGGGNFPAVFSCALQPDGKVLIVGRFTSYNGTARNRIARLNADGSLDTGFNPGTGVGGGNFPAVFSCALEPNGKVLIGGDFTNYNGIYRSGIARVLTTGVVTGLTDEGLKAEQNFFVYPVPFLNALTIKAEGPFGYEILDVRGVMKASGTSQSPEATCNTGNLATGMYLVKITVNGKSFMRKIVRE